MKIIFLDIDGVLNCEDFYISGERIHDNYGDSFYSKSKDLLNKLIEETGAKIVISSTWRHSGLEIMKEMWKERKMSGEIIGITPCFRGDVDGYTIPRGCEIEYYLKNILGFYHINWSEEEQLKYMEKSGIENYIIIDDDSDMLYGQRRHFVHVLPSPRNMNGFNEEYYIQALNILNKNIIQINFN